MFILWGFLLQVLLASAVYPLRWKDFHHACAARLVSFPCGVAFVILRSTAPEVTSTSDAPLCYHHGFFRISVISSSVTTRWHVGQIHPIAWKTLSSFRM